MKTSTYKQFTSQRKPSEHALQEHIIISSVFVRREKKKNLENWSKEGLQFELTPGILELQRTKNKALFEKSTLKDPTALLMLKIQSNYLIFKPRNKNTLCVAASSRFSANLR